MLSVFRIRSTFFEQRGLALKSERGGRVFPDQGNAADVQKILDRFISESGVVLQTQCEVKELLFQDDKISEVNTSQGSFSADNFVVATGGLSYPETGCTGDGYDWASQSGHKIVAPEPALVPVKLVEDWTTELIRFNMKNVRISLMQAGKKLDERFGEAFFLPVMASVARSSLI